MLLIVIRTVQVNVLVLQISMIVVFVLVEKAETSLMMIKIVTASALVLQN